MIHSNHLPIGFRTFGQTKRYPTVRWSLALLFVVVVVLTCFIDNPWWKFVGIQTALGTLALWKAFAPCRQRK